MPPEMRRGIFLQFPLGYAAGRTNPFEPFVAKPSCGPAVSGVVHHEGFVAVGGDPGLFTHGFDGLDTVQQPFTGRPDLDFFDEPEQFHPFAVEASLGRLGFGRAIAHADSPSRSVGRTGTGCHEECAPLHRPWLQRRFAGGRAGFDRPVFPGRAG